MKDKFLKGFILVGVLLTPVLASASDNRARLGTQVDNYSHENRGHEESARRDGKHAADRYRSEHRQDAHRGSYKRHHKARHRRDHRDYKYRHYRNHQHRNRHLSRGSYFGLRFDSPTRGHGFRNTPKQCHEVARKKYWHGRLARVGGTMCYNRYGEGRIVSGSRYLIHYY